MIDITIVVFLFLNDKRGTDGGKGVIHKIREEKFGAKVGRVIFFRDTKHRL